MGFEKQVLNQVKPLLKNGEVAYFENGTLFLENVSDESGEVILKALNGRYDIQVNIYGPIDGFVVDFV